MSGDINPKTIEDDKSNSKNLSRRGLLQSVAGVAAITATVAPTQSLAKSGSGGRIYGHPVLGDNPYRRSAKATRIRIKAANAALRDFPERQETNGDESLYRDYRGSFTKALPHNKYGEVNRKEYRKLLRALRSKRDANFEAIRLGGARKLANPQAAYRFEMTGLDSHSTWMRPAPTFTGAETASEMGELYWKALCRDVSFIDYETDPLVAAAINDLNNFSEPIGPNDGFVSEQTVFRGETPGDLTGPYISQLLLKDIPFGNATMEQRYATPTAGVDFMTKEADWLEVQRGNVPETLNKSGKSYIYNARALGEFVHVDFTYQAYQSAALILLGIPGSFDDANPYRNSATQGAFSTFGGPDVLDLVAKAGNLSLTGAWYQKWLVHRRARPEAYGGRLHHQVMNGRDYGLPDEIAFSEGVDRVFNRYGTFFLPMAFAEGSPTHPSYPAGHATIAGACCTVLKAFFQEDMLLPDPVMPSRDGQSLLPYSGGLTIGGEINKLANNIALGRDWAGVHYRSDGVDGLEVGEQQAVRMLQDYSRTYNEDFAGFQLTRFNGERIRIVNGRVL